MRAAFLAFVVCSLLCLDSPRRKKPGTHQGQDACAGHGEPCAVCSLPWQHLQPSKIASCSISTLFDSYLLYSGHTVWHSPLLLHSVRPNDALFLSAAQVVRLEKTNLFPPSPQSPCDFVSCEATVAFDYSSKNLGWRMNQQQDQRPEILKDLMKEGIRRFDVMQPTKINMLFREKSDFHSKMQVSGKTTDSLVLCLKKVAIVWICICLFLICRCWLYCVTHWLIAPLLSINSLDLKFPPHLGDGCWYRGVRQKAELVAAARLPASAITVHGPQGHPVIRICTALWSRASSPASRIFPPARFFTHFFPEPPSSFRDQCYFWGTTVFQFRNDAFGEPQSFITSSFFQLLFFPVYITYMWKHSLLTGGFVSCLFISWRIQDMTLLFSPSHITWS